MEELRSVPEEKDEENQFFSDLQLEGNDSPGMEVPKKKNKGKRYSVENWPPMTVYRISLEHVFSSMGDLEKDEVLASSPENAMQRTISWLVGRANWLSQDFGKWASRNSPPFKRVQYDLSKWNSLDYCGFWSFAYHRTFTRQSDFFDRVFTQLGAETLGALVRREYLIFFARQSKHERDGDYGYEIFCMATYKAWESIVSYRDYRFAPLIAQGLLKENDIFQLNKRPLLGPTISQELKGLKGFKTYLSTGPLKVVQNFMGTIAPELIKEEMKPLLAKCTLAVKEGGVKLHQQLLSRLYSLPGLSLRRARGHEMSLRLICQHLQLLEGGQASGRG